MSIEAFGRCLLAPLGGNPKLILLGLANHAHPDGTRAFPTVGTLATYAHTDPRTVQRNLRKLAEDGWIEDEGSKGPNGQTSYRLLFGRWEAGGGESSPPGTGATGGGGASAAQTVQGNRPRAQAARDAREAAPEDFPDELRPHANAVFRVLNEVAVQHNAKRITPLALGRCLMANDRKPLVATAHELWQWAADPPRPIRDVLSTYRTFLRRAPDLAAVEHLGEDGRPAARPRAGGNVSQLRPRDEQQERWASAARAEGLL